MRPGAAERLGIDYAAVAARNPRIVYAAASGYRKDGPERDRAAFDDVIQGESGLAAINGGSGRGSRAMCRWSSRDKLCGYVLASSVGMALFHRERTGEGQEIHVPMLENDGRLQHGRPSLARRVRRAGEGARLPAHADAVAAAIRRPRTAISAFWRRPTGSGATCSRRSIARRLIERPALLRRSRRAPPISTRSTRLSASGCAAAAPPNGASGSTRHDVPNGVVNDMHGGRDRSAISTPAAFSSATSTRPKGRCVAMPYPVVFSRLRRAASACRRRASASTMPKSSARSATARRRSPISLGDRAIGAL